MCFMRPEHFTGVLLFLCIIYHIPSSFGSVTYAASLNSSEEIKRIFHGDHDVKSTIESVKKGVAVSSNFAEGGLLNINPFPTVTSITTTKKINSSLSSHKNASASEKPAELFKGSNNGSTKNSTLQMLSVSKTLQGTKLNDTGSNLFLGVPEVIHINGTSSIKPRKGVYFNKIVPRKGVENESGEGHWDSSCVSLGENDCYNSKELKDVDCSCCKEGNILGKTIQGKEHVECKNCKPVIVNFPNDKHICQNICCYDKFHKPVLNTQHSFYKNASDEIKKGNDNNVDKIKESSNGNLTRHKPTITKVPYDVEAVTEILSKAKQKVFVPVLVSILLLPLIGILVFVIFRKTKEIWDKRYYKRMDFLIDGMYQD